MIPRFRYGTFRWIFALGNAVVWFCILYGLGDLVHDHFAQDHGLSREGALYFFTLTPFVSCILASQGAIVSLRAQYLIGRFSSPPPPTTAPPAPENVWLASIRSSLPLAAMASPLTLLLGLLLPEGIADTTTSRLIGAIGGSLAFLVALTVADREFRRFQFHLGAVRPPAASVARYLCGRLAAPWGAINVIFNSIFAWMLYHQGPGHSAALVAFDELRHDLSLTTFMVCLFTALPVIPEVETDFAAGITPLAANLSPMPPLWLRLALAGSLAGLVWLGVTMAAHGARTAGVTLESTIIMKAAGGGTLATLVAYQSGRWALARCQAQVAPRPGDPHRSALA
jgi:hypothetical protein